VGDIDVELEYEDESNWLTDGQEIIADVIETVEDDNSVNNQEIFADENIDSSDAVLESSVKKRNKSEQEVQTSITIGKDR